MRIAALCLVAWCLIGCGGDDDGGDDGAPSLTTDAGDGFGRYCDEGPDCDDDDSEMTDECVRCAEPNKGCPCEPGTKYMTCDPEDKRIVMDGMSGTLVCSDGARYCRRGLWSDCEILMEYSTFVPDSP